MMMKCRTGLPQFFVRLMCDLEDFIINSEEQGCVQKSKSQAGLGVESYETEDSMNELREYINMAVRYTLEILMLCVLCVLNVCVACVLGYDIKDIMNELR